MCFFFYVTDTSTLNLISKSCGERGRSCQKPVLKRNNNIYCVWNSVYCVGSTHVSLSDYFYDWFPSMPSDLQNNSLYGGRCGQTLRAIWLPNFQSITDIFGCFFTTVSQKHNNLEENHLVFICCSNKYNSYSALIYTGTLSQDAQLSKSI